MVKRILVIVLLSLQTIIYSQNNSASKFTLNANYGKSFLSYGDIWGVERKIGIEYGKNFSIGYEYGFANYSGSEFTEDYYKSLSNSSLVTTHLNSFIGGNQQIKFFGYRSLETKNNLINITSHQLKLGYKINLFAERFRFGLNATGGFYKLDRIATDFVLKGVNITNPNYSRENVTIFGTYLHSYLDFSYGFGSEAEYMVLKNRMALSLGANASLSSVRWFTVSLGSKVII
jgi:hypothetical protein